jgi:hypothetical protein
MAYNLNLTDVEQNMMINVRHLLGNNLSDFLLSGLGETRIIHRRAYTAQTTSPQVEPHTYQFEMVSESSQGLPIDRDPLVLAAMLDLLCERQPLNSTILFRKNDILTKLQWPQDATTHELINLSLERYALTAYCLNNLTPAEDEYRGVRYACIGRLLIGYETTATLLPCKISEQSSLMRVQFLPALIHDVISERKSFLGIEFQKLGMMQRPLKGSL